MPKSQSSDADNNNDVSSANNKLTFQENQLPAIPLLSSRLTVSERFLQGQALATDIFCALLSVALIAATIVTFCNTKSILSFGFLPFLKLLPSIRRRKEEAIFSISPEDLQIKLKELDVEVERIRKQNVSVISPLLTWVKGFIKR